MGRKTSGSGTWGCPGWKSPWHSALVLLAASVFSSCFLRSQAVRRFIPVAARPVKPTEGGDVTLIPQGSIKDPESCGWYRGVPAEKHLILIYFGPPVNLTKTEAAYTGREKVLPPLCSLHVTKLRAKDSATYFVTLEKGADLDLGGVDVEVLGTPTALPTAKTTARGGGTRGLSKGAIAGIVVGCLAVIMAIAGV